MKTFNFLIVISIALLISSCKNNNPISAEEVQSEKTVSKNNKELVLTESTLGSLKLVKGMNLNENALKEAFPNTTISKEIGEQDGPNYFLYTIGNQAIFETPNTENSALSQVRISGESTITDEYGVKIGTEYSILKEQRKNMSISTKHYHIYLSQKGSNISYEMSLGGYNGPDKEVYTFADTKNSKVIAIIWK